MALTKTQINHFQARKMACRLTDNFVLGRIEFEEAADKLEAAIFWEE